MFFYNLFFHNQSYQQHNSENIPTTLHIQTPNFEQIFEITSNSQMINTNQTITKFNQQIEPNQQSSNSSNISTQEETLSQQFYFQSQQDDSIINGFESQSTCSLFKTKIIKKKLSHQSSKSFQKSRHLAQQLLLKPKKSKVKDAIIRSKVKENLRKGKNKQSKAQIFIKMMSKYHFNKNFEQFYCIKLSLRFSSQQAYDQLNTQQKVAVVQDIIKNDLQNCQVQAVCKESEDMWIKQFTQDKKQFMRQLIINFYENLYRKAYKIMLLTQKKRIQGISLENERISSQYLDVQGNNELYGLFSKVYEQCKNIDKYKNIDQKQVWNKIHNVFNLKEDETSSYY